MGVFRSRNWKANNTMAKRKRQNKRSKINNNKIHRKVKIKKHEPN
jgi:hypothetical protein